MYHAQQVYSFMKSADDRLCCESFAHIDGAAQARSKHEVHRCCCLLTLRVLRCAIVLHLFLQEVL
jgi:hypothetical protein